MHKHILLSIVTTLAITLSYSQSGRVGIGESSPGSKGSIKGNLSVGSNFSSQQAPTDGAIIEGKTAIGTVSPDASAKLQIDATDAGILIPRVTTAQRNAIASPATGLLVYVTDNTKGFWYYDGTAWVQAIGPKGDTGSQGTQGLQGNVGPQGAKGDKGDTGNTGAQGATGPAPSGTGIVTVNNGTLQTPGQLSGDVITTGPGLATTIGIGKVTTDKIADNAITSIKIKDGEVANADLVNMSANTIKGRISSNGTPQDLTSAQVLSILGITAPTGDNLGNHTATTTLNMNTNAISGVPTINVSSGNGNGLRFWSSDSYKISMGNSAEYQYGPVTSYSIKNNMSSNTDRGWTWGIAGSTPIMALNTQGKMQLADDLYAMSKIGIGTTNPAQGKLWVQDGDVWITGNNSRLGFNTDNTLDNIPNASIIASQNGISGTSADLIFNTWNGAANTEIMRIRSNGNVGIGITAPSTILHVGAINDATTDTKAITVESNGFAGIYLKGDRANTGGEPGGGFVSLSQDNAAVEGILGIINANETDGSGRTFTGTVGNSMLIGNKYNGALHLGTNNTVRMTVASNGTVSVNNLAGTGNKLVYADANGTLNKNPTNYAQGILYGSFYMGDFGGNCGNSSLGSYSGIISSVSCNTASSNDASFKVNLSSSISSYIPFITVRSNTAGAWNNNNDQTYSIGNITSSSFELYMREVSGNSQSIWIDIMLMVKSY
ncbi:MAG: collagen-like protein [Chitinophagales bacterium]|nr:collagen-like protein [Chitinophagales bacterium]